MKVHKSIVLLGICILGIGGIMLYNSRKIEYKSSISAEKCFICGTHPKSLMSYYSKFNSIGVVNLETFNISDTYVRKFTEHGSEIYQGSSTNMRSFGKGNGNWMIDSIPGRGVSDIEIRYGNKSKLNLSNLTKDLCETCLEVVLKSNSEDKTRTAFLVDFQNRELYPLDGTRMKNDFYIHVDHENRDNEKLDTALIVYVPQKEEEGN